MTGCSKDALLGARYAPFGTAFEISCFSGETWSELFHVASGFHPPPLTKTFSTAPPILTLKGYALALGAAECCYRFTYLAWASIAYHISTFSRYFLCSLSNSASCHALHRRSNSHFYHAAHLAFSAAAYASEFCFHIAHATAARFFSQAAFSRLANHSFSAC